MPRVEQLEALTLLSLYVDAYVDLVDARPAVTSSTDSAISTQAQGVGAKRAAMGYPKFDPIRGSFSHGVRTLSCRDFFQHLEAAPHHSPEPAAARHQRRSG